MGRRLWAVVLVWLLAAGGLGVPVGAQSGVGLPVGVEPPLGVGGGLVAGQVDGVLGGGEDGFAEVEAEPGSPPLDGPLDEDLGRLDLSGAHGPVSGQVGVAGPVAEVFGGGFLEAPVEVEAVEGPAPEGFGGLAMCAGEHVCGNSQYFPGPTGLSCSVTASVIVFSWNAVSGADDYTAKLQLASGRGGQTVRTTSGTTAVYAGLSSSTRYYIGVHSNVGGVAQYYSGVYCTTAVGPPVCGAVSASGVQLYWKADSRVHQWYVGRATVGNQYVDGRALAASTLSTVFTGLAANVSYTFFFWWRASPTGVWNQVHPSAVCTTTAPPAAPVVSCTATASTITVNWTTARGASRYRVSRGSGWASASGLSHVFSNLADSTAYTVRVQGWNTAGWGQTGTATCTTPASVLPAPTGLECEATSSRIRFSWDAVAGADGYSAKVQLAVPNSAQTQMRTASTEVVFGGLAASTRYWVSVLAVKGGKAQHFAGVYCTTLADISAPALSCTATSNSVSVSWPKVTGATKYRARIGGGAWTDDIEPDPHAASVAHVFTGLAAGTLHTVTVQSGGEKGWGNAAQVRCVTAAAGVDCDQTTSDSVVLEWEPIDEAQYWYAAIWTGSSWTDPRTEYTESRTEFTGLARGSEYEIHLWWYGKEEKWHKVNPASRCYTKHLVTPVITGHTTGGTTLTIQWQPVDGAQRYQVKISPAGASGAAGQNGGQGEQAWETVVSTGTFHTFTDRTPGARYTVQLRAVDHQGNDSAPVTADHDASPAFCEAATATSVTLAWDDANKEYQWRIRQRAAGGSQQASIKVIGKHADIKTTFDSLESDTEYEFTVERRMASPDAWEEYAPFPHCHTSPSSPVLAPCPQAADVDGTIRWEPNGADYYRVTLDSTQTDPGWIITNSTAHTFSGLAEGKTYNIAVQARNPQGWSQDSTCNLKTLPPIPNGLITGSGTYYFTEGTVKGVLYAAQTAINNYAAKPANESRWNTCKNRIDRTRLAAIMLAIPPSEAISAESLSAIPSPMTLSRYDNLGQYKQTHSYTEDGVEKMDTSSLNLRLYSHMTEEDYLRAHWSPGVGLWQLDFFGPAITLNHAERADIAEGGVTVATFLLHNYCRNSTTQEFLKDVLNGRWHACWPFKLDENGNKIKDPEDDSKYLRILDVCFDRYANDSDKIFVNGTLNVKVVERRGGVALDQVDGGISERQCRWSSNLQPMRCYLYDTNNPQGALIDREPEGSAASGLTPYPSAFISVTDPHTGIKYAVWPSKWPRVGGILTWPKEVVSSEKTIYRAVMPDEYVRCSPGRDPSPESPKPEIANLDCAEETYEPFGKETFNSNFDNEQSTVEGWFDDGVPYRKGKTEEDKHKLQVQHCGRILQSDLTHAICWWVDI